MSTVSRWVVVVLVPVLAAVFSLVTTSSAGASPNPTTTTLSSSVGTPVSGQLVTFTATVAEQPPGASVPTGAVAFQFSVPNLSCAGNVLVETLVGGIAQCTTTGMLAAQAPIGVIASYVGNTSDASSTSSEFSQPVGVAATNLTVSSSTVHAPFSGTGCTTTAGSAAVNCLTVSGVTAGASVSDATFDNAIPSGTTVETVSHSAMTLSNAATLTESGDTFTFVDNPSNALGSDRPGTFTATIVPVPPAGGIPTGTVTWTITGADSSAPICATGNSVNVNRRTLVEQCKVPQGVFAASGSPYVVEAVYSGDGSYSGSSGSFNQLINPATTRTFVAGTRLPAFPATAENFTASVVPSAFGGPPSGSITFVFTALPIKVNGCALSSTPASAACPQGSVTGVVAGYDVSDITSPTAIASGTTVLSLRAGTATLSSSPSTSLTGQLLLFTPAGSGIPTVGCSGGNTLTYVQTGTTCTVPAVNGFADGSVWGLTVDYSGDSSDAPSSSRQLRMVIQ